VEHTAIPEPPGFSELSKEEQIRYVQALWGRITAEPDDVPVLESHLALSEERLAEYRRDPTQARPAFDVLDEIAERLRHLFCDEVTCD
jgi:putative addiction module component (TIGR02574 family)